MPAVASLTSWTKSHLQALIGANTQDKFDTAFGELIYSHASITVNGKKTTRAGFVKELWREEKGERSGSVIFKGIVEVPQNAGNPLEGGEVGVFYEARISFQPFIVGNPEYYIIDASVNLMIEEDPEVEPLHGATDSDGRKVTTWNGVFLYKPGPIAT